MIDTKALREKILDLAMQGKLVPQNSNDEPASELLKRIKEEKEELIKQKKIKRDKNETEIFRGDDGSYYEKFADEVSEKIVIPYEIPQNWSWCRIVTATKNISAGGDKPKEVSMKQTDEFPYPIFSNGIKDNGLYGYSKEAKIFEKSVTVSARGTIGFTAIRNEPYTPIVRLISIIPPQGKLDVGFLKYMLSYLIPVGEGTSIPQLTVPGLKPFLIALPPYQEQLKIVDAINEYFILIDEIEANQKSLASLAEQLKKKVLDVAMQGKLVPHDPNGESASELLKRIKEEKEELIKQKKIKRDKNESEIFRGDDGSYYEKFMDGKIKKIEVPYEIPENWTWARIVSVTKNISAGGDKPKEVSNERSDEFPYPIFSNGVKDNGLYGYSKEAKVFEKSVTVSARGTIGFVAIRSEPYTPIVRLISVIPIVGTINVKFLKYMLAHLIPTGEGTSIPQLTVPGLKPFLIALPPYGEQQKIVDVIEQQFYLLEKIGFSW